jgi:hypothetical protein
VLAEYRRGGVTLRELANRTGISVSCLSGWLRKAKPEESAPELWVELPQGLPSPASASSIYTVRFAGGAVLVLPRGFNPEEAASLCRVLGQL